MNYTAYHVHTEDSLLDSCTNYKDYIDRAVELGQTALGFSEHGNIFHWFSKWHYCHEKGIKYLHGIEVYLTETLNEKIRDNYHTVLIAKNQEGFREINYLYFLSTREDHVYYKPRLTFDEFLNISDNVIKISACVQSPLNKYMLKIKDNHTSKEVETLTKLLKHYDYYEIQYHNMKEQIEFNQYLYEMSKRFNKPLIVGTDTHSLNSYKAECRVMLQYGKSDGAWGDEENECDLTYKTYDELVELFRIQNSVPMDAVLEALENTNRMANSTDVLDFDTHNKYPILYGEKDEEMLWNTLRRKYKEKVDRGEIDPNNQKYIDNIKEEMAVFKKVDMIGFMLFMSELISWVKDNHIAIGLARGSCFTKDALVLTDSGYKTIDNVVVGDKVISDDCTWHNVINTMQYDIEEPMVEVKYYKQGSSYKKYKNQCTLDHKFLVNRNGTVDYVEAKDLVVGDLLCSPKINNDNDYEDIVIDLNDYNDFGFEYDDKYIYEKVFVANRGYKYSPKWLDRHGYCNHNFAKKVNNGYRPTTITQRTQRNIDGILKATGFKTLDDYANYCSNKCWVVRPIKRYIKRDMFFNVVVGMMYGDGWTQKDYAIGLAVNSTTKQINKRLFYKFANKLGIDDGDIYVNTATNGKNLQQLFINSRILNNYWSKTFFKSQKGKDKVFNSELFKQSVQNLKGVLYGLKITDGSNKVNENKLCYDSTSLSLIGAYNILDNMVNHVMPNSVDVRLSHVDKRNPNWVSSESYKTRRSIVKTSKSKYTEDENYWYLPILEINYIEKHKNTVYDLTVSDKHSYVVNNIIVHNCAGSTVAYISDITDVDPVKWNTVFSRFCNEHRVEIGDIDCDFYEDDRPKIYEHIIDRFGADKTGYILAVGTLADKAVIDMLGKAFRVRYGDDNTIYSISKIKEIKKEYDSDPQGVKEKYSDLFYYYDGLKGCVVSQSQHPAGIIVAPLTLADNFGMFYGKEKQRILPIDMDECHELGLVKYDILGLKTVGIIDKTCKLIGKEYPKAYKVNWEDQNVYADMTKDHTAIFQFESDFAGNCLQTMDCHSIFDMSLANACIRPSGESYRDKLLHKIPNKNPSEIIDKLLKNNYGYLVYQEDTIAFLQQICGFSGSDADNVRRAIGRKQIDRLNAAMPQILDGYCSKSSKPRAEAEDEARQFIQIISDASSYQFGLNHSIAYSLLSYLMGYYRYYYPVEFCTAFLNCAKNDEDLANGQVLAQSRGVKIQKPIFRYSTSEYGCDSKNKIIYKGIGSIKNIGTACGDNLNTLKDNHYDTFIDLLYDISQNSLANKTEITLLIMIDFFREFGDINYLLECYKIFMKLGKRCSLNLKDLTTYNLTREQVVPYCEKATEKMFRGVDMKSVIKLICANIKYTPINDAIKMVYEIAVLGYSDIIVPCDNKFYIVSNKETNKYGTTFVTAYRMCDGQYVQYKVNRKAYAEMPCDVGDAIMCYIKEQAKMTKVIEEDEEKWVKTDAKEVVIKDYAIVRKFEMPNS